MKKNDWKKLLSIGVAAIMAVSLSACGNSKGEDNKGNNGGGTNSDLAKQYVYSYDMVPIKMENGETSIQNIYYANDRVYTLANVYYMTEEKSTNSMQLYSFKSDGSDVQNVTLEVADSSEEVQNSWVGPIDIGEDGSIVGINELYKEDYSDPENPIYENQTYLISWNQDGTQKWSKQLELNSSEDSYSYINNLSVAGDGKVNIILGGDKSELLQLDGEGNEISRNELNLDGIENLNSIYVKEDGKLLITLFNEDWSKMSACTYDLSTNTLSEKIELAANISMYNTYPGSKTDFILTNSLGVYTYNIGDAEVTQIMSYVNSDLATDYIQGIVMIDEEHFVAAFPDSDYNMQVGIFTKVDPNDIPDKSILVLGANYLDTNTRMRVIDFNKSSEKYRITVKDYSTYNTSEDYMASYTKMNNDIIAGNMPDILVADAQMPIDNYIAKGLIADVGELIAKDEELSKKKFMENVFDAYKVDGKLYYVIPNFTVGTVIGKASVVGDREGWNMEEMQQVLAGLPEDTNLFADMTRSTFLYQIMQYGGSDFVDVSTGKCNFDSPEFINLLEFAQSLPEEINYDYENENYWKGLENQYRENKTVLMMTSIYMIKNMNYTINGQFGEDVNFIGFPNENRNGSVISANQNYVISSKSKNLDGAWEFLRYYLTDEFQTSQDMWGMPVEMEAFMAQAKTALERPYWVNEKGEKEEYDDTFNVNGEEIILPPMSEEQMNQIIDFVKSVNRRSYYNESISKIVEEEAAAFFAGQKSASDVANVIQSRVQIYVNENR